MSSHFLVICEQNPVLENTGSSIRTMNFCRALKKLGKVDVIYCENKDAPDQSPFIDNFFHFKRTFDKPASLFKKLSRKINEPFAINKFHCAALGDKLREQASKVNYQKIFIRYGQNALFFLNESESLRKKIIVDLDDIMSGKLYDQIYGINSKYTIKKKWDKNKLIKFETAFCNRYDKMLLCSENSKNDFLLGHPGAEEKNITVVPNTLNHESPTLQPCPAKPTQTHSLVFIGLLNYSSNIEGLAWFIDNIFPEIQKVYPEINLQVVGRDPTAEVRQLVEPENIELHENVPTLQAYYENADVVIVPLLSGSGTRIKILEAMLHKRPVLSTPLGAEGLCFDANQDIALFSNADEFIGEYNKLRDNAYRDKLINNAYKKTVSNYSQYAFDKLINELVSTELT